MASNAIVSCARYQNYAAAVEFLEQSLSVTFNQLLDLQTDLSLLETHHPDFAHNLRRISEELREIATSASEGDDEKVDKAASQSSDRMRKLALERDNLLKQVRALPDFEHFLLPLPFSKLREAAAHGPIVMITCTDMHCDVLIILKYRSSPLRLRLRRLDSKILQTQHRRLKKALEDLGIHTRDLREGDRAGRVARQRKGPEQTMLDEVLQWLYQMVVLPIYGLLREVCYRLFLNI
jgi:septal ring factor EnvC (AmiA/AmiB activator)